MESHGPQGGQPAGWYPNPQGPGQRSWDGSQWTAHYSTPPQQSFSAPPQQPQFQRAPQYQQQPQKSGGGLWWKIALGIVVGGLVLIVGCSALISAGLEEQQDENAITNAEYRAVKAGESQQAVLDRLGEPESEDEYADEIKGVGKVGFDCRYWNLSEEGVGSFAQVCFDGGKVESKSRYEF